MLGFKIDWYWQYILYSRVLIYVRLNKIPEFAEPEYRLPVLK